MKQTNKQTLKELPTRRKAYLSTLYCWWGIIVAVLLFTGESRFDSPYIAAMISLGLIGGGIAVGIRFIFDMLWKQEYSKKR